MATASYPFPYPSAATYPPPLLSGGYYPSPFPYASSSYPSPPAPGFFPAPVHGPSTFVPLPPAPPQAYPYPYPPPASAYTAATGHAPQHHPIHLPCPQILTPPATQSSPPASAYTPAPAPTTFSSPYSQVPPSTPPTPAPPPTGAPSLSVSPETTRRRLADQVPSSHLPSGRSITPPRLLDTVSTSPNQERTPLQNGLTMELYANEGLNSTPAAAGASTGPAVFASTTAAPLFSNTTASSSSPVTAATTTKVASAPSIFCNTSAATSSSKSYLSYPFGPSGSAPTQACDSVSVMHPSAVPSTMACVAPKLFVETPTPISCQGTHDMAPDYCFGHDNSIQSSCVSKSIEQNLNARPQPYGLHNLNRQSVLLADGTKHIYFTLPTDYPLERVVREPMFDVYDNESDGCSNEFVQVFTGSPEQQTYEVPENYPLARATSKQISAVYDEITEGDSTEFVDVLAGIHEQHTHEEDRHETEQPPKCFSKQTFSPERPTVGAFSLTNEEPICGIEKLNGGEKMSFATQDKEQLLKCYSKVSAFRNVPDVYVRRTCQEESQGKEKLFREKYVCQTVTGLSILLFPWDPGATKFPVLFITVAQVRKLLCTNVFKSELTCSYEIQKYICRAATGHSIIFIPWDPGDTKLHVMFKCAAGATNLQCTDVYKLAIVQTLVVKFGAGRAPIFKYAIICADAFGLGCTEVNASVLFVLVVPCSTGTSCSLPSFENRAKLQWNPGVLNIIGDMRIDKYAVSHQVQFIKMITEHSFLSLTACIQYICPNDISSELHATCFILQRSAHLTQDNYLCSVYWNNVMKTSYVWDPGVKISLYSWLDILTVWSETDKLLSCTHIPDLAAWHNQSVGSGTSYIWDPGTILWYTFVSVSNTLNAYYLAVRHSNGRSIYYPENIMCYLTVSTVLEEKEMPSGQSIRFRSFRLAPMQCNDYQTCNSLSFQQHSHQDITFCEIALWLIHFQPP